MDLIDVRNRALDQTQMLLGGVETWGLATATGQQTHFDPDIVQAAMEIVQEVLMEFPRGTWFGPQLEGSDDLSEVDRLAAFLGRSRTRLT